MLNNDKIVFRCQENCHEAYRVTGSYPTRCCENTVIVDNIERIISGALDGMAECVNLKQATEDVLWLHFLWEEYNE